MTLAPAVQPARVIFRKAAGHESVQPAPELFAARAVLEHLVKLRQQRLAIFLLIKRRKDVRPGSSVTGGLGFVGEDAVHAARAEFTAHLGVIVLIRGLNKRVHHVGIHIIHVIFVHLGIHPQLPAALPGPRAQGMGAFRRVFGHIFAFQIFQLIFFAFSVHLARAETARPAVLVVHDGHHAVFAAFVDHGAHAVHPLFPGVGNGQTAPGVHHIAAQSGLVHLPHLPAGFLGGDIFQPAPVISGTVFHFRICQRLFNSMHCVPPAFGGF